MIPISDEDTTRRRSFPIVNLTIIAACFMVFFYELALTDSQLATFVNRWGVVSAEVLSGRDIRPFLPAGMPVWVTVLTGMFIHAGWLHLLGNMLYLFIFGDNIENAVGHVRYLLFYVVCGGIAAATQTLVSIGSTVPSVGASGAIAGVLGAYLIMFPAARVNTVVVLGLFFTVTTLPAIVVIGIWGIMQFFNGVLSLDVETVGGVAYFAHVGGFVAGLFLGPLFRRRDEVNPRRNFRYD